jgi:hypothetical protein
VNSCENLTQAEFTTRSDPYHFAGCGSEIFKVDPLPTNYIPDLFPGLNTIYRALKIPVPNKRQYSTDLGKIHIT